MGIKLKILALPLLAATISACSSSGTEPDVMQDVAAMQGQLAEGATLIATTNLHIDPTRRLMYSLNYQLPTLMPVCSTVTITDISTKVIQFTYQGSSYKYMWEKYTRGAGQSLAENFMQYFGEECDQNMIQSLSSVDQEGIEEGRPKLGMSKDGVLIAMGRPPIHANPDIDQSTWTYWQNKWMTMRLVFDQSGKLTEIVK